ncbi:MAG: hypothetical protein EOP83_20535, partial [Verrucomicrobiaceae bacterium]
MRPDEDDDLMDADAAWDDLGEEEQAECMNPWIPPPDPDVIMDYKIVLVPTSYEKHHITYDWKDETGYTDQVRIDAHAVGVVGDILVLNEKYDAEQIWFPFVQAILTKTPPTKEQRIRQILDDQRMRQVHGWRQER